MKRNYLTPVILSVAVAIGVLLGVIISRSNNAIKDSFLNYSNTNMIDKVFYLIENEYVDTVNLKDLQVKAVTNVIDGMDPHSEYFKPEVLEDRKSVV